MKNTLQAFISRMHMQPRQLFLFDGLGALLSAFMLGVVLVQFHSFVGIPVRILQMMAVFPVLFAVYDACCWLWLRKAPRPYLVAIAVMNLLYCALSVTVVITHFEHITFWGLYYKISEMGIVMALAGLELKVAQTPAAQQSS